MRKYKWLIDGIKISKKKNKKMWNRKVRRTKNLSNHCFYKKLAGESMWDMIP